MRLTPALAVIPALILPLEAQSLSDRFKENYKLWEMTLDRGDGASVRKSAEALLQKEGLTVGRSDYNEMRALTAVLDAAARACVLDGAWEDAVSYLKRASDTAAENLQTASPTFSKLRKEHEQNLTTWKEDLSKAEPRFKEMETQPGLTQDMLKQRSELRVFIEEHRNAIAHSEWSIREIDGVLAQIQKDQETYSKSLASWQAFLAKEKQELEQTGPVQKYVADKLEQVKADDAKTRYDRLAYARRLGRLDPTNSDCTKFVQALLGGDASDEPAAPKPHISKKKKKS